MSEAISGSCNAYFYTIAKKIGIDNIVSMAQKFGLGNKSGIELPGEVAGLLPSRSWKFRKYNKEWLIGDTINSAVGQGYVLTTIMQLAVMTARIASGKEIIPRIVQAAPLIFTDLDIPLQHLNIIRQGMSGVLQSPIGTAYGKNIPDQDFAMAGKTGTAQVVSKKSANQDFSKAGTKWAHKNHAGFIAFAPYHCPRFACAAILEHGGGGGNAIPIVRDLLFAAQKL
jgi:penicillin-binding protein 2